MRAAAYLIITNITPHEWHAAIHEQVQSVGRGSANQVRIPVQFTTVSRRHAEVWADPRGLWLRDVGSTAGTFVNGVRIDRDRAYQIRVGDRIWLGDLEFEVASSLESVAHVLVDEDQALRDSRTDTKDLSKQRKTTEISADFLLQTLTPSEREVVLWMSRGYTHPDDVAGKLFRSPHTVRTQLNSIFRKLGVHSRDELLGWLKRSAITDDSGESTRPPR